MKSGIYGVKNKINGKWYIGQSNDIQRRNAEEKNHMKKGYFHSEKECNSIIVSSIKKYGYEAFEFYVIEYCPNDKLDEREMFYIQQYNSKAPNGYNLTDGGNSIRGYKLTEKDRKKMSEIQKKLYKEGKTCFGGKPFVGKGKNNPRYGKHCSDETKKKIIENRRSFVGELNPNYGKHHSKYTKMLISQARLGKKYNEEWCRHISEGSKSAKKVRCIETGVIYRSCVEAGKAYGLKSTDSIGKSASGKIKTSCGLHWEFVNETN